jgi:hypothetical protein
MVSKLYVKVMAVTLLALAVVQGAAWTQNVFADGTGEPKCTGNRC